MISHGLWQKNYEHTIREKAPILHYSKQYSS